MIRTALVVVQLVVFSIASAAQEEDPNLHRVESPSLEVRFPDGMTPSPTRTAAEVEFHGRSASTPEGESAVFLFLPRPEVTDPSASPWPILEAILGQIRQRSMNSVHIEGATALFVGKLPGLRYALVEPENPHPVQFCQLLLCPDGVVSQIYGVTKLDRKVPAASIAFFDSVRRPGQALPEFYRVEACGLSFRLAAGFLPRVQDEMIEISHDGGAALILSLEPLPAPRSRSEEMAELAEFLARRVRDRGPVTVLAGPGALAGGMGLELDHETPGTGHRRESLVFVPQENSRLVLSASHPESQSALVGRARDGIVKSLELL